MFFEIDPSSVNLFGDDVGDDDDIKDVKIIEYINIKNTHDNSSKNINYTLK